MHIKKVEGEPRIVGVPENMRVIAFGNYGDGDHDLYYAFFCPRETELKCGSKIEGVRIADGGANEFEMLDNEVIARRDEAGGYHFEVKISHSTSVRFKLYPDNSYHKMEESTYEGSPTRAIFVQLYG